MKASDLFERSANLGQTKVNTVFETQSLKPKAVILDRKDLTCKDPSPIQNPVSPSN